MAPPDFGYSIGDVYGPVGNLIAFAVKKHNNAQPKWDSARQEILLCKEKYEHAINHNKEHGALYSPQENFVLGQRAERVLVGLERAQENAKVRPEGFRQKIKFNGNELEKAEVYLRQNRERLESHSDAIAKNAEARKWKAEWRNNEEYDNPPPYRKGEGEYSSPGYGSSGYGSSGYGGSGYGGSGYGSSGYGSSGYGSLRYDHSGY